MKARESKARYLKFEHLHCARAYPVARVLDFMQEKYNSKTYIERSLKLRHI